jgi:trimethyllysine dioxygenase
MVLKLRLLLQIPGKIEPVSVESTTEGLQVEWATLLKPAEEGASNPASKSEPGTHHSLYPWRWLMLNSYAPPLSSFMSPEMATAHDGISMTAGGLGGLPPVEKVLWGRSIGKAPPTVTWDDVMGRKAGSSAVQESQQEDQEQEVDISIHDPELADRGLLKWLLKLSTYGFCFISGLPATPEATEALVRRIAFIRETHYGGFWDFTSNLEHGDTAYTNLKLQAHTDTTYFTDPAGLQLFHLLSHTDGQDEGSQARGGESLLVDGFLAAKILRESNEEAYKTLSEVRIMTHSAGDDDTLIRPLMEESGYPILQHEGEGPEAWRTGRLRMIRYNNDDRSVLRVKEHDVERFYKALGEWNRIVTDPEGEYWQQLVPGTALSE